LNFVNSILTVNYCLKLLGITLSQFDELYHEVEEDLESAVLGSKSSEKRPKNQPGRSRQLSTRSQLLLFMLWIRQYPVEHMLGWLFGCSQSQISKYNATSLEVMYQYAKKHVIIPPELERHTAGVQFEGCLVTIIIDGSEQQIHRPSRNEKKYYSGKKGMHSFTTLLACLPNGKIIYLSPSLYGSTPDLTLARLPEQLRALWHKLNSDKDGVAVDKGFVGLEKDIPFKIFRIIGGKLDMETNIWNEHLASIRIIVENVFSCIKRYHICSQIWRGGVSEELDAQFHHRVWFVVCSLVNQFNNPRAE